SRSVLGRSPDEATACSSRQASCCPSFQDRLLADVLGLPRALYFEEKFLTAAETTWVTRGVAMSAPSPSSRRLRELSNGQVGMPSASRHRWALEASSVFKGCGSFVVM